MATGCIVHECIAGGPAVRIGVVSNLYPPHVIGGYEQLCGKVCDELAARGHEVVVLTSTYGGAATELEGQIVERQLKLLVNEDDIYRPFTASAQERDEINAYNRNTLAKFNNRYKPDLWFVWNLYFLDLTILDELSSFSQPVSLFLTDNWLIAAQQPHKLGRFFECYVHGPESFKPASDGMTAEANQPRNAIFGAHFMRNLYHHFGFRFQSEVVIHNGVQLPMLPSDLFVPRNKLREAGRLKLLFAGRVVDIKGPQLIVQALPTIRDSLDLDVSLTIVGDMQDKAFASSLLAAIDTAGCADLVTFREPVPEALLAPLFNDHDIYLFPSLYEPFSLTLIHAVGSGIPTVATDVGGNEEIVRNGETGLLFDKNSTSSLANAIIRLATDADLRNRVSVSGRLMAKRYTFRRMISRIETELQKTLNRPPTS